MKSLENPGVLMENSSPVILDISSDEEVGFGGASRGDGFGGRGFVDRDDCEWLSEVLGEVGGNKGDDSYDVVLISETFQNPLKKSRRDPLKPAGKFPGGDDDDCVILEGDPDKPAVVAPERAATGVKADGDDNDGDDVEIVAEKGEVACRDFPHARHLCAKFLFASTAHEIYCRLCHCYVCDSVAPCPHWGTGVSSMDHCHATDKDEYWRAERKHTKSRLNPMPAVPLISNVSPARPIFAQALGPHCPIRLPTMPPSFGRPTTVSAHQVLAHMAPVYRPELQPTPPQPVPVRKSPILKQPNARLVGPQPSRNNPVTNNKKMLKDRHRIPEARPIHRSTRQKITTRHKSIGTHHSNSQPVNVGRSNYMPYVVNNFVSGMTSQPSLGNKIDNPNSTQAFVLRSCSNNSVDPSYKNELGSRFLSPPNQSTRSKLGNQISNPQAPFGVSVGFKQVGPAPNCINSSVDDLRPQISQWQSIEFNKSQGVDVKDSGSEIKGPVDNFQEGSVLADNSRFPESIINYDALDFEFDNWLFEDHSFQGALEVPVSPLWNEFSPEPAPIVDASNLLEI